MVSEALTRADSFRDSVWLEEGKLGLRLLGILAVSSLVKPLATAAQLTQRNGGRVSSTCSPHTLHEYLGILNFL